LEIGIWIFEFDGLLRTPMVSIRTELTEHGIIARKRLGQHFLSDRNIVNKVVETAGVGRDDTVLEVGSGLGIMTLVLADRAKRVIAVEIDPKLAEILREKTADRLNVEVIQKDILEIDFHRLYEKEEQRIKVVANLPYQISTPLLFRLIDSREAFSSLTLMIQKEVAVRMTAAPGGKDYGILSIFTQMVSDISIRFLIKPSAFFPSPKVESAVIHMVWKEKPIVDSEHVDWFKKVVSGSFNYRRKTLINALKHSRLSLPEDAPDRMNRIGIDPQRRPETLAIEEFARLADVLRE
jgi:16S rRNA (adenine1518-N6/adenine1519-N6)-dimethyltransferase